MIKQLKVSTTNTLNCSAFVAIRGSDLVVTVIIQIQQPYCTTHTIGGMDYDATASQLTFSASESRACAEIPITDDSTSEPMEMFTVSLSFLDLMPSPEGVAIMPDSANITIVDNDGKWRNFSIVCDMTLSFLVD